MSDADRERTRWFLRNILPHESALRGWLSRGAPVGVDPDDVIQEAYAILAEQESVEGIRHPRAYLFQVARSIVVRHVRRARIVSIQTVEDLERLEHPDQGASPERLVIDRDELRRLAQAIAAMPAKTREAFVLRRVKGLPQREIAARMRISENTVETHISRGVLFLIDWFGRSGNRRPQTSKTLKAEIAPVDGPARIQSRH